MTSVRLSSAGIFFVVATCSAQTCTPPPPGMVSWWPGDANANDISGTHNPIEVKAVNILTGKVSGGFHFGTRGYIGISQSPNLQNQRFSWLAWVRPDGPGPNPNSLIVNQNIDATHASVHLAWRSADQRFTFRSGNRDDGIASANSFPAGKFYFVAGTYDGITFKLFVNGVLEGSHTESKTIPYSAKNWEIGSGTPDFPKNPNTWNGAIDEVQAYNRALSETEISRIYQAGSEGVCKTEAQRVSASEPDSRLTGVGSSGVPQVGGVTSRPSLITKSEVNYSEIGRKLRAQGKVLVSFIIVPDGTAANLRVVGSLGYGLDEKAMESTRNWRFKPAMKDGSAVPVQSSAEVVFNLIHPEGESDLWYSGQMIFAPGNDQSPRVLSGEMPERGTDHADDSVILEFGVTPGGVATAIHAVHGSAATSEMLALYLETWKFQPAIKSGRPVETVGRLLFTRGKGDAEAKRRLEPPSAIPVHTTPGEESAQPLAPDAEGWAAIRASSSIELFEAFLKEYPNSLYAGAARLRLLALKKSETSTASAAPGNDVSTGNASAGPTKNPWADAEPEFIRVAGVNGPVLLRGGKGVTQPKILSYVSAEYSEQARIAKLEGRVLLTVVVSTKGRVVEAHVDRGLGMGLDEKAIEAVRKWKFVPGTLNGKPINAQGHIEMQFSSVLNAGSIH